MNRIHHANGVITLTFDSLADFPVAAHIATRHGGVSPDPWRSLNFGILRGDDRDRVLENRRRLATALGVHPMPFLIAVTVAASTAFATPVGYQTNTMVYQAGSYRFSDFARIGIPLNILFFAVSLWLIPRYWPF